MKRFLFFCVWLLVSCAIPKPSSYKVVTDTVRITDTIKEPQKTKKMTSDELNAYLEPFYRTNYDKFFNKEFNDIKNTNKAIIENNIKLSESVDRLSVGMSDLTILMIALKKEKDSAYMQANKAESLRLREQSIRLSQQEVFFESQKKHYNFERRISEFLDTLYIALLIGIIFNTIAYFILGYFRNKEIRKLGLRNNAT